MRSDLFTLGAVVTDVSHVTSWCVMVVAVLTFGVILTAAQSRRVERQNRQRTCGACALDHAPFANYCRRCGRKL